MKGVLIRLIVFVLLLGIVTTPFVVNADDLDDISKQLEETKKALDGLKKANANNKSTLEKVNKDIESIKGQVYGIETAIAKKEKEVAAGEKALVKQKGLLDERIVSYYKNMGKNATSVVDILTSENLSNSLRQFFYQKKYLDEDKKNIIEIVAYIGELESKKKSLVQEKLKLEPIKDELAEQSKFLAGEIEKGEESEGELNKKIAELSAKQQAIINARSSATVTSVGSVPTTASDKASTIAYKSDAPANSFAIFSFGAHTHRRGMSQYGAKARAEAGKSYNDILKFYYPDANLEQKGDLPGDINVDGFGSMSFEDKYLLGIAEMPSDWHGEALKAQAIAARTYAYRRVKGGGSICATEACQVYREDKANNSPQAWKDAVSATRGQVLMVGGEPRSTEYSSTSGGWNSPSGWDTTDGQGGGDWTSRAYESIAGSPWFYRAWYRQGYSDSGNSCGRSHPWLSTEEMADIIHAAILLTQNSNGADTGRIVPLTINECSIGGQSGNPYSMAELRDFAGKSGKGVTSISGVSVSHDNNGNTSNVHFDTNAGGIDISGINFKKAVNLRAPGYISIPQNSSYAFFNIEKK